MRRILLGGMAVALAAAVPGTPAQAQGSDTETFIEAVKKRDASKATELVRARGSTVLNGRSSSGETALIVAISQRDPQWTAFLLQKGADPNIAARSGETPLIAASQIGFAEAVDWLLASGAKVDTANRRGETPLIVAVQQRHAPIVRALLKKGADPDRTDAAAGYSARDYAKRDSRSREILALLDASEPKAKIKTMDEFKLN